MPGRQERAPQQKSYFQMARDKAMSLFSEEDDATVKAKAAKEAAGKHRAAERLRMPGQPTASPQELAQQQAARQAEQEAKARERDNNRSVDLVMATSMQDFETLKSLSNAQKYQEHIDRIVDRSGMSEDAQKIFFERIAKQFKVAAQLVGEEAKGDQRGDLTLLVTKYGANEVNEQFPMVPYKIPFLDLGRTAEYYSGIRQARHKQAPEEEAMAAK